MSVTITQNQFDGGIASDLRTHNQNQCADSTNFDVFTNPYKLIHRRDMIAELDGSNTINDIKISDVGQTVIVNTEYMVAFGVNYPTDVKPAAYIRAANTLNGSWGAQAVGVAGFSYLPNTYIQYNNVSYVLGTNNGSPITINLQKYTSAGTMTAIDTVSYALPAGVMFIPSTPRPFVHPTDNRLYLGVGNVLAVWDGVSGSFIDVPNLLPMGYVMTAISNFGDNLAISMSSTSGGEESILCIWDRDYVNHATYLTSIIRCGRGNINAMSNLDGNLALIMSAKNNFIETNNYLAAKVYAGGQVETITELRNVNTYSNQSIVSVKRDNKIYFARSNDNAVYCFGKNKQGRYILTHDYLVKGGTSATSDIISTIKALSFVGGCLYVAYIGYDNVYRLMATDFEGTISYSNPSVYTTTINPNMPISDRNKLKRLIKVRVLFEGAVSGTCTLKYAVDGLSTFTLIDAHDMSDLKNKVEGSAEDKGVPFAISRDFQFQITSQGTTSAGDIIGIVYEYENIPEL